MPIGAKIEEVKSEAELKQEILERLNLLTEHYSSQYSLTIKDKQGKSSNFSNIHEKKPTVTEIFNKDQMKEFENDIKKENVQKLRLFETKKGESNETQVKLPKMTSKELVQRLKQKNVQIVDSNEKMLSIEILTDESATHFHNIFKEPNEIKSLKIRGKVMNWNLLCLGIKGWGIITQDFKNLSELHIQNTKIGMDEAILITSGFGKELKILDLWENGITSEVAFFIINSIVKNQHLIEHVNLGNNELDAETRLSIKKLIKETDIVVDLF